MATDITKPDPVSDGDEAAGETPPTAVPEEMNSVGPGSQIPLLPMTPRRWSKPVLPLVDQNALPMTSRRRTKPTPAQTPPTAVKPTHLEHMTADEPEPVVPDAPPEEPEITQLPVSTNSPAPIRRRNPASRVLIGMGVLLIPVTGYIIMSGGMGGTPPTAANESVSSPVVPAIPSPDTSTSTASSLSTAPERKPGLPDPTVTAGEHTSDAALPPKAASLAAAPPAISAQVRADVLRAYNISDTDAARYVLCYLIPPSLNGTNSVENVFPVTPWFADLKSRLDRQLTQEVVTGQLTLAQAQKELTENWVAAAHRHYIRNYGENSQAEARKIENRLNWEQAHPGPVKPIMPVSPGSVPE